MRILVLSNVPPGVVGGAEVQALLLGRHWAGAGHEVLIAGQDNVPDRAERLTVLRIPLLRRSRAARGASYLLGVLWLLWRRRREFDVVYCRFLREHAFAAALARQLGLIAQPVVACPASTSTAGEAARIARSPVRRVWLHVFRHGLSAINAMSRRIELEVRELGLGNVAISRIPNGVVIPMRPSPRVGRSRPFQLLFVGRLVVEKGIETLLDAARRVRDAGFCFNLRIVGDGPLRTQLADTVRTLALGDCVTLMGALPPARIAEQFAASDLFVLPSLLEGMPGVLLEAMAHALPVVATRVSGSEDVVDPSVGWLVPVGEAPALAVAIGRAIGLGCDGLAAMGSRAREKACSTYDIELTANRHLQLFSELIDAAPPSRRALRRHTACAGRAEGSGGKQGTSMGNVI